MFMYLKGLTVPEFSGEGNFFVVKFYGPGEKILDLVPSIPKERQTDLIRLGLNKGQIEALRLMDNEKKILFNKQYCKLFDVSNQTFVRDMKTMITLGFVCFKRNRSCFKIPGKIMSRKFHFCYANVTKIDVMSRNA